MTRYKGPGTTGAIFVEQLFKTVAAFIRHGTAPALPSPDVSLWDIPYLIMKGGCLGI
jgi:hypothetical protein